MNSDVNNSAGPSTAVVADGWDENGTPIVTPKPEPPKKEESAASATPAKAAKPEEKHAEPGAAKQEPKPKAKPSAEERISELTAERKAAENRAKELEERVRTLEAAAKSPAKAEAAKPKEPLKRPNPFTWKGTPEEYEAAMDEYEKERDSQAVTRARQEQARSETQKTMSEMLNQAATKHPDAKEKIIAATTEVLSEKTPLFVKAFINESEVIGELLYTLSDSTTLNNLLETAKTNPGKALRVLRDMELDVQKALSKSEVKAEAKPEEKAPETKPRAPKPPSEVGGRGAATESADIAAARDGKFGDFEAEQRRKYFRAN